MQQQDSSEDQHSRSLKEEARNEECFLRDQLISAVNTKDNLTSANLQGNEMPLNMTINEQLQNSQTMLNGVQQELLENNTDLFEREIVQSQNRWQVKMEQPSAETGIDRAPLARDSIQTTKVTAGTCSHHSEEKPQILFKTIDKDSVSQSNQLILYQHIIAQEQQLCAQSSSKKITCDVIEQSVHLFQIETGSLGMKDQGNKNSQSLIGQQEELSGLREDLRESQVSSHFIDKGSELIAEETKEASNALQKISAEDEFNFQQYERPVPQHLRQTEMSVRIAVEQEAIVNDTSDQQAISLDGESESERTIQGINEIDLTTKDTEDCERMGNQIQIDLTDDDQQIAHLPGTHSERISPLTHININHQRELGESETEHEKTHAFGLEVQIGKAEDIANQQAQQAVADDGCDTIQIAVEVHLSMSGKSALEANQHEILLQETISNHLISVPPSDEENIVNEQDTLKQLFVPVKRHNSHEIYDTERIEDQFNESLSFQSAIHRILKCAKAYLSNTIKSELDHVHFQQLISQHLLLRLLPRPIDDIGRHLLRNGTFAAAIIHLLTCKCESLFLRYYLFTDFARILRLEVDGEIFESQMTIVKAQYERQLIRGVPRTSDQGASNQAPLYEESPIKRLTIVDTFNINFTSSRSLNENLSISSNAICILFAAEPVSSLVSSQTLFATNSEEPIISVHKNVKPRSKSRKSVKSILKQKKEHEKQERSSVKERQIVPIANEAIKIGKNSNQKQGLQKDRNIEKDPNEKRQKKQEQKQQSQKSIGKLTDQQLHQKLISLKKKASQLANRKTTTDSRKTGDTEDRRASEKVSKKTDNSPRSKSKAKSTSSKSEKESIIQALRSRKVQFVEVEDDESRDSDKSSSLEPQKVESITKSKSKDKKNHSRAHQVKKSGKR